MDHITTLVERYFKSSSDELHIEKVPVSAIVAEYGTPLYIYDRHILDQKWSLLRDALPSEFAISYSVKANPNRTILRYFVSKGCGLEIASGGELHQALKPAAHRARSFLPDPERQRPNWSSRCRKASARSMWSLCLRSSGSMPSVAGWVCGAESPCASIPVRKLRAAPCAWEASQSLSVSTRSVWMTYWTACCPNHLLNSGVSTFLSELKF